MNNYIPEGLQEFAGYKNEFLRKIQKATAPYHEATMAVQKAIEPYYKATASVQKAMKPIYETNERIQKILTPTYTVQELIKQASKPYASPIHNSANLLTQAFIGGLPPVIKAPRFPSVAQSYEVQELVRTINNLASDDSVLPSDTINDINNADVHIDTVDVSEEFAFNISSALEDDDIFVETTSSKNSKAIYIDAFKKYLIIFITLLLPLMDFPYTLWHDYVSDKANAKYQSQMLEDSHKQTQLLDRIDSNLSKIKRSISTEKH